MNAEKQSKKFDIKRFVKNNVKIPGIGLGCLVVAFILAIVSFANYYSLYETAGYDDNRWTIMFSWMGILCLVFLIINSLFKGDKPTWTLAIYGITAFLLISAMLQFLQPCVSEIAFVLGSPDLAMGDNAIRVAISDGAIMTAVLYVVTCVFVIIAAFAPAEWTFGKKRKKAAVETAEVTEAEEQVAEEQPAETVAEDAVAEETSQTTEEQPVENPVVAESVEEKPAEEVVQTTEEKPVEESAATERTPKKRKSGGTKSGGTKSGGAKKKPAGNQAEAVEEAKHE